MSSQNHLPRLLFIVHFISNSSHPVQASFNIIHISNNIQLRSHINHFHFRIIVRHLPVNFTSTSFVTSKFSAAFSSQAPPSNFFNLRSVGMIADEVWRCRGSTSVWISLVKACLFSRLLFLTPLVRFYRPDNDYWIQYPVQEGLNWDSSFSNQER